MLVQKCWVESWRHFGIEPCTINVPFIKQQVNWLFQNNDSCAIVFAQFARQIDNHFPTDKLLQITKMHFFIFPDVIMKDPVRNATLAFTNGSSNGRTASVIMVKDM